MGVITGYSQNDFISAQEVYSKVRRFLSSYASTNTIDEAEFPVYTAEVLNDLGIGAFAEEDAILFLKDEFHVKLPDDFSEFYSAYKCKNESFEQHSQIGQEILMWNDVTIDLIKNRRDGQIECEFGNSQILERVKIKQFLGKKDLILGHPQLLTLSPNVRKNHNKNHDSNYSDGLFNTHMHEITISNGFLYTNFKDAAIYLKYYAFPTDEDGLPMIPNISQVQKAVEWYIIYQLLLTWMFNSEVPDIQNKMKIAELESEKWIGESNYILKLPAFSQMVNSIRNKRAINKVSFFSQSDYKR